MGMMLSDGGGREKTLSAAELYGRMVRKGISGKQDVQVGYKNEEEPAI